MGAAALPIILGAGLGGVLGGHQKQPLLGAALGGLTGGIGAPLLGLGAAGAGASALVPQASAAIAAGAPAVSIPTLGAATAAAAPSALSQAGQIGLIGSQLARNLGLGQVRPPAVGVPPQPGQFPAPPVPPPPITQAPSIQAPGATPNIQQLIQLLQQRGMF